MKKFRYEIIIFIINAVSMILELVASRVLSPYFGNSNIVWTSVIGIILLSSSIGNYLGGKIADKENLNNNLKIILVLSAFLILIIPFIEKDIISLLQLFISNLKIGAILCTILIFLLPSVFLGLLTPIILKLKIKDMENVGRTSGKVVSIATIGGIFGTFLGGFVLIPTFGSIHILFILSIITILLVPLVDFKIDLTMFICLLVVIILLLLIFVFKIKANDRIGERVLNGEEEVIYTEDTEYGRVLLYNSIYNNEKIRILNVDKGFESATFIDENKKNELVFDYTKAYNLMFNSKNEINNVLLIGGAGYSYPKYYISHYDNKKMDVVEIDDKITNIAKKYFYLDDLINEYNLNENNRLNLIKDDGRTYLNKNEKKYDAILNDAFSGVNPAKTLTTLECVRNIKKSLNENGLYLTNIISAIDGKDSKFLKAEINTINKVFKYVYVFPCAHKDDYFILQNNMVIATDDITFEVDGMLGVNIDENEIILTDDYCPVDTLVADT